MIKNDFQKCKNVSWTFEKVKRWVLHFLSVWLQFEIHLLRFLTFCLKTKLGSKLYCANNWFEICTTFIDFKPIQVSTQQVIVQKILVNLDVWLLKSTTAWLHKLENHFVVSSCLCRRYRLHPIRKTSILKISHPMYNRVNRLDWFWRFRTYTQQRIDWNKPKLRAET